jgi:hypothetical protein
MRGARGRASRVSACTYTCIVWPTLCRSRLEVKKDRLYTCTDIHPSHSHSPQISLEQVSARRQGLPCLPFTRLSLFTPVLPSRALPVAVRAAEACAVHQTALDGASCLSCQTQEKTVAARSAQPTSLALATARLNHIPLPPSRRV